MPSNDIQVNLRFNADISKAKASMNELQKSLDDIMGLKANQNLDTFGILESDLEKASQAAATLQINLQNAFNVRTGKIDFIKLNQSLKQSGMTAESLRNTFQAIGPAGQQAFMQLSQAIATSEIPLIRITDGMRRLGQAMINATRWQISSSVLHGLMSGISRAYGYAQDLNESLNNIRIVTGQSVEQMDKFAEKANKAAKALSVSTTAYTDAALIFYQQGLNDQEVEARTNVTMKMANITGQSATEVSSQMTAIWNNFAKGSENLEYFGDVITRLGAETASSSDEISQGLGKFAAVADTVGLSYEKASAALATVVAETRQSADVVGTAFRTIFARLEGLNLGETLDDGVTLNKYSAALEKVGVNILDQQGQLKQMDSILDELGNKWNNLSEAQKVALSETVAGVRQYTQFMALMNNYNEVMANQQIAESSGGTVEKQQEIYAESWEAASKRAKAALEGLYATLLDDKGFIEITNGFAKIIDFVKTFTESLGGLKGVLLIVSTLLMKTFSTELGNNLNLIGNSMMAMFPKGRARIEDQRAAYGREAVAMYENGTTGGAMQSANMQNLINNQRALEEFNKKATPEQQKIAEIMKQRADLSAQEAKQEAEKLETLEKELETLEKVAQRQKNTGEVNRSSELYLALSNQGYEANASNSENGDVYSAQQIEQAGAKAITQIGQLRAQQEALSQFGGYLAAGEDSASFSEQLKQNTQLIQQYEEAFKKTGDSIKIFGEIGIKAFENLKNATEKAKKVQEQYNEKTKNLTADQKNQVKNHIDNKTDINNISDVQIREAVAAERELKEAQEQVAQSTRDIAQAEKEVTTSLQENIVIARQSGKASQETIQEIVLTGQQIGTTFSQATISTGHATEEARNLKQAYKEIQNTANTVGQSIVTLGGAAMQLGMAINSLKSLGNIWSDEDISLGEKLLQTMMSLSMILPVITTLTNAEKIAELSAAAAKLLNMKFTAGVAKEEAGLIPIKIASGEAGYFALGPLVAFVAIAGAAILLIWGIAEALKAIANAETDEAKALREANEQLEEQQKLVEETKQSYEDVKSALEGYNSALETLYNCTQGTKEWYEATENLNSEIQSLLDKYPELTKYENLFNPDGTLNQRALQDFEERSQRAVVVSQIGALQARNNVAVKTATSESAGLDDSLSKLVNASNLNPALSFNSDTGWTSISNRDITDAFSEALKENGGFNSQGDIENFIRTTALELAKAQESASEGFGNSGNEEFETTVKAYAEVLYNAQSQVEELNTAMAEAAQSIANSSKIIQQSFPEGTFSDNLFDNFNQMIAFNKHQQDLIEKYNKDFGDYINRNTNDIDNENGTINGNKDLYNFISQYLLNNGRGDWKIAGLQDGKFSFKVEGQEEPVEISANDIFNSTALNDTYKNIETVLKDTENYFKDREGKFDDVILNFISSGGSFNGTTIGDLANLKGTTSWEDVAEKLGFGTDELLNLFATSMGISAEEFNENFKKLFLDRIVEQSNFDLRTELNELDLVTPVRKKVEEIANNLYLEDLEPISDLYTEIFAISGKEGLNIISSLMESIPEQEKANFAKALTQIDFTNLDVNQVQNAFKSFGVTTEISANQIWRLKTILTDVSRTTVEEAQEAYNQISKIVSKLKNEGDTIEKEQYNQLIALNPALESFFTTMADGTYMLTGAAEEFKSAVQLTQKAAIEDSIRGLLDTASNYQKAYKDSQTYKSFDDYTQNRITKNDTQQYVGSELTPITNYNGEGNLDETITKLAIIADIAPTTEGLAKWQARAEAHELELKDQYEINELYKELISTEDDLTTRLDENVRKANELQEALKFQDYQNEISNVGLDFEETEDYAQYLAETQEQLNGNINAARELAIANQRLDRGLSDLNDNFEDLTNSLKDSNKGTLEYSKAIATLKDDFADILNISSGDKLSTNFVEKVAKDSARMTKILAGDVDTIQEFREEAFDDIVEGLDFSNKIDTLNNAIKDLDNISPEFAWLNDFASQLDGLNLSAEGLKEELLNMGEGASLSQEYTDALNAMLATGQMTADDLNDIFSTIGYKPEVTTKYIDQQVEVPEYTTYHQITEQGQVPMTRYVGSELLTDYIPQYTEKSWTVTSGSHKETQHIPIAQIATDDNGGGKVNITNAGSTSIKPSTGSTSAGKSGGGGGGGGSRSRKEPKKSSDEIERYHRVDKTIDSLAKQYDHLKNARDATYGADKLAIIDRETKLLKEQTAAMRERAKEAEKYLAEDRANVEAFGAVIDANGVISNYDEIMQHELDKLNAVYASYNAGGSSDELVEKAEKDYEDFKKLISQYEDTLGTYQDAVEEIAAKVREQLELELEKIDVTLQIKLDISEEEIKKLDFRLQRLEGLNFRAAERMAAQFDKLSASWEQFGEIYESAKQVLTAGIYDDAGNLVAGLGLTNDVASQLLNGNTDIIDSLGLTGENKQAVLDALDQYRDDLISRYSDIESGLEAIQDEYVQQTEDFISQIEEQTSRIDRLGQMAENIKDLYGTFGKELTGINADIMRSINRTINNNNMAMLQSMRSEQAAAEERLKAAQEQLAEAERNATLLGNTPENSRMVQFWREQTTEAQSALEDLNNEVIEQVRTIAEAAKNILIDTIKDEFNSLGELMFGMVGEDAQASYDRYKALSDATLQDYQKIYELSKLSRAINNSINDTDNIKAKEILRDLEREIVNYQAEGVEMTQYQVDNLNKRYELRLAEIALEEAQNAKDQVRLARNADGGWGYIYTANSENIDKARQNYEDKLYALQELNRQAIEDSQSTLLTLENEFNQALQDLANSTTLTKEQKDQQAEELRKHYMRLGSISASTLQEALNFNNKLFNSDWKDYSDRYGYIRSADQDYVDKFSETWLGQHGIGATLNSATEWWERYQDKVGDLNTPGSILYNLGTGYKEYLDFLQSGLEAAGLDKNGDFGQGILDQMQLIQKGTDESTESAQNFAKAWEDSGADAANAVGKMQEDLTKKLSNMATSIENLNAAIKKLRETLAAASSSLSSTTLTLPTASNVTYIPNQVNPSGNNGDQGSSSGGTLSSPRGYSTLQTVQFDTPWNKEKKKDILSWYQGGGTQVLEKYYKDNEKAIKDYLNNNELGYTLREWWNQQLIDKDAFINYIRKLNPAVSLDSGGYTGNFGPEGRWAILHQKELVLNEQDTKNMLTAVKLVRDSLDAVSLGRHLSGIKAYGNYNSNQNNSTTQQTISIEAHFPNVVDRYEIEQAFNNLANYAAQNAYNLDFSEKVNIF